MVRYVKRTWRELTKFRTDVLYTINPRTTHETLFITQQLQTWRRCEMLRSKCKRKVILAVDHLIKHHAKKSSGGMEVIAPLFLMSDQLQDSAALPLGTEPRYKLDKRLGEPQSRWSEPYRDEKISCSYRESNPGRPALIQNSLEINHVRDLGKALFGHS
jgi:hypothetical protein